MLLGEFLKKHMDAKNMSFAELSRRSGVPASTLRSMVTRNNERVSIDSLLDICNVLGCDINEYVDSIDKSKYTNKAAETEQKKSAPIDRDRFLEMIDDFTDEELYELYVFLKFLIWKRDHSDIG